MKRYIHASFENTPVAGYVLNVGNKDYFYQSDAKIITDKVVRAFINKICDVRGVGDSIRQASLYSKPTLADFRRRISPAMLEQHVTNTVTYYTISGKNFSWSFPEADFENDVIVF